MVPPTIGLPSDPLWRNRVKAIIDGTFRETVPWVEIKGDDAQRNLSVVESHGEILTQNSEFILKIHPSGDHLSETMKLLEPWKAKRHFTLKDTWEMQLWLAEGSFAYAPHVWPPRRDNLWFFNNRHPGGFSTYALHVNHLESNPQDHNAFKYTTRIKRFFPGVKTDYSDWKESSRTAATELLAKEFPEFSKACSPSCWIGYGDGHTWLACKEEDGLTLLVINNEPACKEETIRWADAYTDALKLVMGRRMLCAYEEIHSPFSKEDWFKVYSRRPIAEDFPRLLRWEQEFKEPGCTAALIDAAARFFIDKKKSQLSARALLALWVNHGASGAGKHRDTQMLVACTALESIVGKIDKKLGQDSSPTDFKDARSHAANILKSDAKLKGSPYFERLLQGVMNANPPGDRLAQWKRVMCSLGLDWESAGGAIYNAWNTSRNKLAHGEVSDDEGIQEQMVRLSRLQGGLTTIIAAMTGYQGPVIVSPLEDKPHRLPGVAPELFK